jgi:hypothetical protein
VLAPSLVPPVDTAAPAPSSSLPVAPLSSSRSSEPFKLPKIKDAKAYLDLQDLIQYYLRLSECSTQCSDDALVTSLSNQMASLFWEGQIRVAVWDGSLCFLFENKGTLYHGKGFEMLAALEQHCRPDTVSNAFTTLMSLFNVVQEDLEEVLQLCSRFDGLVMDMSCSKIILLPILIVMLFIRALHSRYLDILAQFCSRYKVLESAMIDSVVEDVCYHDGFQLVGLDKKPPGSCTPKASAANVDKKGNEWSMPFEWLASYGSKGIKTHWERAIAGTGVCLICHRAEKPWHVPANSPLLKESNVKLVNGPPSAAPSPAPAHAPTPTPSGPAPSPSPGGWAASADNPMSGSSTGSASAPSGLMAAVEEDFDSDEESSVGLGMMTV